MFLKKKQKNQTETLFSEHNIMDLTTINVSYAMFYTFLNVDCVFVQSGKGIPVCSKTVTPDSWLKETDQLSSLAESPLCTEIQLFFPFPGSGWSWVHKG